MTIAKLRNNLLQNTRVRKIETKKQEKETFVSLF